MLPSFLHQRNRRRFVLSICPIQSVAAQLTVLWLSAYIRSTAYSTDAERLVRSTLQCCLLLYERVMSCCARWRMEMFLFCFQRFLYIQNCYLVFHDAPLGSTVALTASSCIPVRLQPLRVCAEPPAGVTLVVRTGSGQYQVRQGKSKVELQLSVLVSVLLALL